MIVMRVGCEYTAYLTLQRCTFVHLSHENCGERTVAFAKQAGGHRNLHLAYARANLARHNGTRVSAVMGPPFCDERNEGQILFSKRPQHHPQAHPPSCPPPLVVVVLEQYRCARCPQEVGRRALLVTGRLARPHQNQAMAHHPRPEF